MPLKKLLIYSRHSFRQFAVLSLIPLLALTVACGRETKIYPDQEGKLQADSPITTDGRALLPRGFFNQSVNRAQAQTALDGTTETSVGIQLQTLAGSNEIGGFNGAGTGNRALLGLAEYGETKLTSFNGVTFDAKYTAGAEKLSVLLIVDLACDGTSSRVFIANAEALGAGVYQAHGYFRFSSLFSEARWRVSGAPIPDPNDGSVTLVSSTTDPVPSSLDTFLNHYPNACVRNTASGDDELPKGLPTTGVLFALGSASTTDVNTAYINRITIGDDVYEGLE